MATQKKSGDSARSGREDAPGPVSTPSVRSETVDSDVDSMLSEIDEVLEQNAEEFVKSFIQKGGQ